MNPEPTVDSLVRLLIAVTDALSVDNADPQYDQRVSDRARTARVVLAEAAREGFAYAEADAQFIWDQMAAEVGRTLTLRERRTA